MIGRSAHFRAAPLLFALALGAALAAMTIVAQAPTAAAHAKYTSSVPAANSTVTTAPTVVTVHFGEEVNPVGSDLKVYDSKGNVVSTGTRTVDVNDAKTMTIAMTGDDSESYLVVWNTVSLDDGDAAVGAFIFYVGAQAKPGDTGGSTTSLGAPATTTSGASNGVAPWVVALVGVLGVIVGAVGSVFVAGRRQKG